MSQASAEAIDRHPHLGDPIPTGWIRVDCHSHTMWSGDCTTTPDELVEAVESSGIDVLCITDHSVIAGAVELQDSLPCRVVVGEEVRVGQGELIGLFLTERIAAGLSPTEAAKRIRAQGGLVYVPHPFDPMRNCLSPVEIDQLSAAGLLDGIEGRNAKTSLLSLNQRGEKFGIANDLFVGAGSDAHVPSAVGAAYIAMPDFDSPQEFAASARQGELVWHHYDAARPWTPRIIPSMPDPT